MLWSHFHAAGLKYLPTTLGLEKQLLNLCLENEEETKSDKCMLAIIELTGSARFRSRIPTWQGLACHITATNLRSTTTDAWLEVHRSKRQACAYMFRSWDSTTALAFSFALLSILSCLSMILLYGKDLKHTKNHVSCESSISKAVTMTIHKIKNI